ncbi:hypothetical protein SRHO_G00197790 [Serrasalmus rhombeus]
MTKLQLLHRALNERLMAAVEQIMEMVGGTVLEYEAETIRARKENEILRRRLRWMEGEIPTDWPDDVDPYVPEQPVSLADGPVFEGLAIKAEPVDASDCQSFTPDPNLTASVCTADLETVNPAASQPASAVLPDDTVWDSSHSYMAPLDFDPTMAARQWRGRGRSQKMSFACPDCGKVFGREQRLMFHMRIHSAERPYMYRRRKACFYGDKKRKKKLCGLSKLYPSKEIVEDLSDASEQTEKSTGSASISAPRATAPSAPEAETGEKSDAASRDTSNSKYPESSGAKPVGHRGRQGPSRSKIPQCLKCKKVFKSVSRLATHMKTHRKPFPSQEQQKKQEDADETDKRPQKHPKKPIMRNNEMEVERAKAGGHSLFQCPECKKIFARSCWLTFHLKSHERERSLARKEQKQLPSKKMNNKDAEQRSTEVTKDAQETVAENSTARVLKKIFACPHCDKVFTREGWLGPHIRSHVLKTTSKSEIHLQASSILPVSRKRARRTLSQLSKEDAVDEKNVTKEKRKSEIVSDQPTTKTESQKVTLEAKRNSESKTSNDESERIVDKSNKILEESRRIPEESTRETRDIPRSKKTFSCRECGKVYLLLGCLKTHKKIHKRERMEEKQRRQMLKELGQKERKEEQRSLVEEIMENIEEKKRKRKRTLLEMQHSIDNVEQTRNLDATVMLSKENGDKSSEIQAPESKNKESAKKTSARYFCKHCGKVYARRNWLNMHLLGHREAMLTLQKKVNDEAQKSDNGQMPQEGSSTEDSVVQKEEDGGKVSYPCPFCDKVFRRGMRLMVHMQIHSGEKPYSYRQRKEQFYGDLTRPRVPDTCNQEPAIESSDEREKDGGFALTRNQTSAVSQHHSSTTKPMETVQPHSVCTGSLVLPLQSAGAASNHSMKHPRTDTESVSKAKSHFSLQPRIVLEPITSKSKPWAPPGDVDFRSVNSKTGDKELHLMSDAATAGTVDCQVKQGCPQTSVENAYESQNVLSGVTYALKSETDDSGIVCATVGSDSKSLEITSYSEKIFDSVEDHLYTEHSKSRMYEFWQKDGQVESLGCLLDAKQMTIRSELESSSGTMQQVGYQESVCMNLSDVNSDYDDDDWSNVSNNLDEKKTTTESKMQTAQLCVKDAMTNHPAQFPTNVQQVYSSLYSHSQNMDQTTPKRLVDTRTANRSLPRSSQKVIGAALDVESIPDETKEQCTCDGLLTKRDEKVVTSVPQTKESSKGRKSSSTCMICGLIFAGRPSLSQHMRVHSTSACIGRTSSTFRTFKNNETKIKQDDVHVQTSDVHRDDSADNSEILGNSDSATVRKARAVKSSGCQPDTKSRCSKRGWKIKSKELKKEKKTVYCRFCSKACRTIELHLQYDHSEEPEVIEALHFSKTQEERKKLLSRLYRRKSSECENMRTVMDKDLVHCLFCQGSYQRSQFWKHALVCEQKEPERKEELTLTEATSSVHTPNTRPNIAQKTLDSESEYPIQKSITTAQRTLPESLNAPLPDVDPSIYHKSLSLASVFPESCTELNPTFDPVKAVPNIFTEMMSLDSESSGQPILDACHSTTEMAPVTLIDNSITESPDVEPSVPLVLDSCHRTKENTCLELKNDAESSTCVSEQNIDSECSGLLILQSCPHQALTQELVCPPVSTRGPDIKQQSTLGFSNLHLSDASFSDVQKPFGTSFLSSSFQGSGCCGIQENTIQDVDSLQNLDCIGEGIFSSESVGHVDCNSHQTPGLKSQRITTPRTDIGDLQQTFRSNAELEQMVIDSDKGDLDLESTDSLIPDPLIGDVKRTDDAETGSPCSLIFDSSKHRAPKLESGCPFVLDCISTKTQRPPDPDTDMPFRGATETFDSEGHVKENMGKIEDSGRDSVFKVLDSDCTAVVKRKLDSQSIEFKEAKRSQQSDPPQQSSAEVSPSSIVQTSNLESGFQASNLNSTVLENRGGKAK